MFGGWNSVFIPYRYFWWYFYHCGDKERPINVYSFQTTDHDSAWTTDPLQIMKWTVERLKSCFFTWNSYCPEKTIWLSRNFNPIEKSPSERWEKRGSPYEGNPALFQTTWGQIRSGRNTKIEHCHLEFLLSRETHLIEQKLQSDRKKSIWALRKAWQPVWEPDFSSIWSERRA